MLPVPRPAAPIALLLGLILAAAAPAQVCRLSAFGNPCSAQLSGFPTGPSILFTVQAVGLTPGVLLVGTSAASFTLPNSCTVLVSPLVALPYQTDRNGMASLPLAMPAGLRGVVRFQAVQILRARPGFILHTSQRLDLACR